MKEMMISVLRRSKMNYLSSSYRLKNTRMIMKGMDPAIKLLDDIWIIRKEGTVLYHREDDDLDDHQLVGSFMSAIDAFARQIDKGGLSNFQIGTKKYIVLKNDELYFLASCAANINPKKAQDALIFLSGFFLTTYKAELREFNGNVKPFINFESKLRESMDYHWILT